MTKFDALVFICEILSFNDEDDGALHDRIASEKTDWPLVVKITSDYFLSPALGVRLERGGLLDALPDKELADYFITMKGLNAERNKRLRAQAVDVCRIMNSAGTEPVLLKGAGNVLSGLYDDPAIRFMRDIDILIKPESVRPCLEALHSAGYREIDYSGPELHHHRPLFHDDYPAPVELHTTAVMPPPAGWILSAEDMFADAQMIRENGAVMMIPSPQSRMVHNIAHASVCHGGFDMIYILQMYDMVMLARAFNLDWPAIKKAFDKHGKWARAQAYLERAGRLFGEPAPEIIGDIPLMAPLTRALFKGQVNSRSVRGMSFIIDNYVKVAYRMYTSGPARKRILSNLLAPRFYSGHVNRMTRAFRKKTP